jgi:hypothetical protein
MRRADPALHLTSGVHGQVPFRPSIRITGAFAVEVRRCFLNQQKELLLSITI